MTEKERPLCDAQWRTQRGARTKYHAAQLPTLSRLDGSTLETLRTGDFVLYRPRQGDSLTQFETIQLVRGGRLAGSWRPFPRRL